MLEELDVPFKEQQRSSASASTSSPWTSSVSRKIGKPRGWTLEKSPRRVGVGEVVGRRRLRED